MGGIIFSLLHGLGIGLLLLDRPTCRKTGLIAILLPILPALLIVADVASLRIFDMYLFNSPAFHASVEYMLDCGLHLYFFALLPFYWVLYFSRQFDLCSRFQFRCRVVILHTIALVVPFSSFFSPWLELGLFFYPLFLFSGVLSVYYLKRTKISTYLQYFLSGLIPILLVILLYSSILILS